MTLYELKSEICINISPNFQDTEFDSQASSSCVDHIQGISAQRLAPSLHLGLNIFGSMT